MESSTLLIEDESSEKTKENNDLQGEEVMSLDSRVNRLLKASHRRKSRKKREADAGCKREVGVRGAEL